MGSQHWGHKQWDGAGRLANRHAVVLFRATQQPQHSNACTNTHITFVMLCAGRYTDEFSAVKAYDKAAVYLYGRSAITNFGLEACKADCTTEVGPCCMFKGWVCPCFAGPADCTTEEGRWCTCG